MQRLIDEAKNSQDAVEQQRNKLRKQAMMYNLKNAKNSTKEVEKEKLNDTKFMRSTF